MIELDGNYGEGGGALLRVALAASTLTGQPFKVKNIRSGRPKPGLKQQHLSAIKALKEISGAKSSEVELGSEEMWFSPGKIKSGSYTIDIGTAGSITLLLQAIIMPCMFASGKVTLIVKGGTCGKWQASVDYLNKLLLPQLRRFVKKIELKIMRRGYYPKGGGEIILEISPKIKAKDYKTIPELLRVLEPIVPKIDLIEQGKLEQIQGTLNMSEKLIENRVDEIIVSAVKNILSERKVPIRVQTELKNTLSLGGELLLWSIHSNGKGEVDQINPIRLSGDALLEPRKSAEDVGREAANELLSELKQGVAVDKHLADQLLQFMAILPGSVIETSKVSDHCKTNIYVLEKFFLIKFSINKDKISVESV